MNRTRGFTLIEVLITAGILVSGLVAVASVFSFAIRTNNANRQATIATVLLVDKMEQFRSLAFTDSVWTNANGSETLVVAGETYIRSWKIGATVPRSLTVTVQVRSIELIRSTTLLSPTF